MEWTDARIIDEMVFLVQGMIKSPLAADDLYDGVATLSNLRDHLRAPDREWLKRLNTRLVTLDSAASWTPCNPADVQMRLAIVKKALFEIVGDIPMTGHSDTSSL